MSDVRMGCVRDFLERVWSSGEIDACDDYLADSYTIEHDPGDPWEGRTLDLAGFKNRVRQSRAPFPDQRFAVQAMLAGDAGIAASWTWTATHRGDLPGFPSAGRAALDPAQRLGRPVDEFGAVGGGAGGPGHHGLRPAVRPLWLKRLSVDGGYVRGRTCRGRAALRITASEPRIRRIDEPSPVRLRLRPVPQPGRRHGHGRR